MIIGKIENWHFEITYYLGLSIIALNYLLILWTKRYFVYILGLSLLIALSGLVHFFPFKIDLIIFGITLQVIPLILIIAFCFLNRNRILYFLIVTKEKNGEEEKEYIERKKKIFRKEFEKLSNSELLNKLNEKLAPEAVEVIKDFLENKKENQ